MNFNLGREGYTPERGQVFFDQLVERAAALPGVRGAAIAQIAPLAGGICAQRLPGRADTTTRDRILVQVNTVGTGYFQTIGIPIVHAAATSRAPTPWRRRRSSSSTRRWRSSSGKATSHRQALQVLRRRGLHHGDRRRARQQVQRRRRGAAALHLSAAAPELHAAGTLSSRERRRRRVAGGRRAARGAAARSVASVFNVRTLEEQVGNSLQPLKMNVMLLIVFGAPGAAARVDRPVRRRELFGLAAHARDRRAHGARRAARERPRLVLGHGMMLVAIGIVPGPRSAARR